MEARTRNGIFATLVLAVVGLGGVALAWLARSRRSLVQLPQRGRVALIGDSLAVGLASPLHKLTASDGGALLPLGRISTTITMWAHGDFSTVAAFAPDVILVSLGTNDAALARPQDEQRQLEILLASLTRLGVPIVWIDPPELPTLPRSATVRWMLDDAQRVHPFERFRSDTLMIPRQGDQVHPTPAGYGLWAATLWAHLHGGSHA